MGFFIMTKKYLTILSLSFFYTFFLSAQNKPEWTNTEKNTFSSTFYYGVGTSQVSSEESDTRAFIEFSRNVKLVTTHRVLSRRKTA